VIDDKSVIQKEYEKLSKQERELLHRLFHESNDEGFSEEYHKLQKVIFKKTPPTPEEFLDWRNGWLPKHFSENIYDWVKEDFCSMLNNKKHYSHIVLYGATRLGKSFCAILLILYIIVYTHHLRDLAMYYNLAGGTSLSIYILSFNYDKTYQLYLQPIYNVLRDSQRFKQVKFQDQVIHEQEKYGCDTIVYSKAALVGEITLASNLKLVMGNNDALSIIGNNILMGVISEIAFFIENDGATEDQIFRLYSDLVDRINATVGKSYLAFTFLDTSANDSESLIEEYILKTLKYKEDVLFRWRRRWDVPELVKKFFPIYSKTKETFPVCIGDGTTPPKIIYNKNELQEISINLIQNVPIDAKDDFERNLIKSIKDIAGQPTTNESKFIQRNSIIDNIFNNEVLQNIEGGLICDSGSIPNKLIYNQLDNNFFVKFHSDTKLIKRATKEPRYAGIDLSYAVKGDVTGVSIGHKEWSRVRNTIIYVCDFTFAILPGENGINIESVGYFLKDLFESGITFANVVFDTFQSEQLSQFLTRNGIPNLKNSVDASLNPYLNLYSLLISEQVKSGKNIFLRNNLKSLYRIRNNKGQEKIDHSKGVLEYKYFNDWDMSKCGTNAKDVSDALTNWIYIASQDNYVPIVCYEEENNKMSKIVNYKEFNSDEKNIILAKNSKKLLNIK